MQRGFRFGGTRIHHVPPLDVIIQWKDCYHVDAALPISNGPVREPASHTANNC